MAEHLGIEFMGMEQSVLILRPSYLVDVLFMFFFFYLLPFCLWCEP